MTSKKLGFFMMFAFVLSMSCQAFADYFWMVPSSYNMSSSGGFFMGLGAGHDFPRSTEFRTTPEALPKSRDDFGKYVLINPNGTHKKLLLRKKMPVEYGNLVLGPVKISQNGSSVLAVSTKIKYLTRDESDWKNISKKEAKASGSKMVLASIGTATFAKTLVHLGTPSGEGYKTVIGQGLEIVPQQNPGFAKAGEYLKLKVLYNGKALQKEKVVYQIAQGKKLKKSSVTLTSSRGIARIKLLYPGKYLVEIDHADSNTQWEDCNEKRFHSSITFEVKE